MAKAQFLPVRQMERGNPMLGALGSIAGGVAGTAIGGPLGAKVGSQLGGQIGGTGQVDPAALLAANRENLTDYTRGALGFEDGGKVPWYKAFFGTGEVKKASDKISKRKAEQDRIARELGYKATGGMAAPRENLDDVVIGGLRWLGEQFEKRDKKLTGKSKGERKKNLRPERKAHGGAISPDTVVNGKFMSSHVPNFTEKVGPLAKTMYKSAGGETWERAYHNPLMPKPSAGGDKPKPK